jgi:ubiquinone/menaquinone biosynthesis C-methylase UbiE
MICKYCQIIHSFDKNYPQREATKDVNSDYPRCDWHWRFVCSICGRPRHFNGITWCEKTRRFICLSCAKSHRIVRRKFWNRKLYYTLECDVCSAYHPALDYLEFSGKHPWQLHPKMQKSKEGLDPETILQMKEAIYVPLKKQVVNDKQIAQAWDKLADKWSCWYTEYGDINRRYIIDPAIFRLIGSVKGLSILDAGCGNGYLCRLLAKKGAKMVGVDVSKSFIKIAMQKEKEASLGITYHIGSLSHMKMFQAEIFDMVISNLALMDVLDFEKAMKELYRVLKYNGRLLFSIMHPCFSSAPVHGWVRVPVDSQRKEDWIYWKVDRYFDRSVQIWQYLDWPSSYSFHRPLQDYIKTLIRQGFAITDFEEPVPTIKAMREHYRELGNECDRIPWFLIIGVKKI